MILTYCDVCNTVIKGINELTSEEERVAVMIIPDGGPNDTPRKYQIKFKTEYDHTNYREGSHFCHICLMKAIAKELTHQYPQ